MNNQTCKFRPTLIDWDPNKLNYLPFMVNLGRCNESGNIVEETLDISIW